MNRSEQIRHDQEIAAAARPVIIDHLCNRRDPAWIGRQISQQFAVEQVKAFRWVQYIDEEYQRVRRRVVNRALAVIWGGTLIALAGVALRVFSVVSTEVLIAALAIGIPTAVAGAVRVRSAGRIAGRDDSLSV